MSPVFFMDLPAPAGTSGTLAPTLKKGLTALEQRCRHPHAARRCHADAASWLPSGRKYCVPLIGADTFRSSSCKS